MTQLSWLGLQGYRILENRFALSKCLSVSRAGELYAGWDLNLIETEGNGAKILLHLINKANFPTLQTDNIHLLKEVTTRFNNKIILSALTAGETDSEIWFVFKHPGHAELQALPTHGLAHPTIYQQVHKNLRSVQIKQSTHLDPNLMVASADHQIYVIGTALLAEFKNTGNLWPTNRLNTFRRIAVPGLVLTAGLAAASTPLFWQYGDKATQNDNPMPVISDTAKVSVAAMEVSTVPVVPSVLPSVALTSTASVSVSPTETAMTPVVVKSASQADKPERDVMRISIQREEKSAVPKIIKASMSKVTNGAVNAGRVNTAATGIVRDNSQADKLNKSAVLTSFAKEKPLVKVTQPIVTQKAVKPVVKPSEKSQDLQDISPAIQLVDTESTKSAVEPADSVDQIIKNGYGALQSSKLGTQAGGAMYYVQQLNQRSPGHPQVNRLVREVVLKRHAQARSGIQNGDISDATQALDIAKQLIRIYNLKDMNDGHQLLVHKLYKANDTS